jgi:hypothetical protein
MDKEGNLTNFATKPTTTILECHDMLGQIIGIFFPKAKINYFGELKVFKTSSIVVNKIMLLPLLFKTYLVLEFIWS